MGPKVPQKQRLQFKQNLTKDSKLTITELIKRLISLHTELSELDQDVIDTNSLSSIRKELIQPSLLVHKDKTVKALVACGLADLLRLYAPDAPYTRPELKAPNQSYYLYLLESLATVQSIVLICDIPSSEELMTEVFKLFFDVVSTEMSKNIPLTFADLLAQIINQAASYISPQVLKYILAQFEPKNFKANPAAYRLAVDVCNACEDKLQSAVCRYFTDLIILGAKKVSGRVYPSDSADEDAQSSDEEDKDGSTKQIKDTHILIKNIHKACPGLLLNVIPQLQVELETEQADVRLLATETLGEMFAAQPSSGTGITSNIHTLAGSSANGATSAGNDLARRYPNTWKVWISKSKDISPQIRIAVIQSCKSILSQHPHLKDDINQVLFVKLTDPDEKVRLESCKFFVDLEFNLTLHYIQTNVLRCLGNRIEDKKQSIQQEALKALGRLYDIAEDNERSHIAHFGWIPQVVLSAMFIGEQRLCVATERCMLDKILPLPKSALDETSWVDRLITVSRFLNPSDLKKLKRFTRITQRLYLDVSTQGGIIDHDEKQVKTLLAQIIRHISTAFPDPSRATEELQKFAKLNDKRMYKVIKVLSDPLVDLKALVKTYQEFNRKLESLSAALVETIGIFLRKSAYLTLSSAVVPTLLSRLHQPAASDGDADEDNTGFARSRGETAKILLDMISTSCSVMLKPHIDKLTKALFEVSDVESGQTARLIDACLLAEHAESYLFRDFYDLFGLATQRELVDELTRYALSGTPEQAKYAAIVLAKAPDKTDSCREVNLQLANTLKDAEPGRLVANLSALSQIAKLTPNVFEAHSETVATFILQKLLLRSSEGEQDGDDEWLDDSELADLAKARILGVKLLTNRCIAYAETTAAKTSAAPVFKLLWQLLDNRGHLRTTTHSQAVAMRLRLKAAHCILKLATCKAFSSEIDTQFDLLAWVAADPSGEVREGFVAKLAKYLHTRRLTDPRFNVILFLVAHDPESDIIELARSSILSRMKQASQNVRVAMFEVIIVRLLHLLVHHPDFELSLEALRSVSKHIEFYVDCVANGENVSLMYYLVGQLKAVQDVDSKFNNELVIRTKAKIHHWTLPTYPGKAILPTDLFQPISSPEEANQIAKKTYLGQEFTKELTTSLLSRKDRVNVSGDVKKPSSTTHLVKPTAKARAPRKRKGGAVDRLKSNAQKSSNQKPRRTARPTRKTVELDADTDIDKDPDDGSSGAMSESDKYP
ncbi:uncharacterized protein MELLADRAFT_69311 [Melampsora larici-populina 98AG31]|uniref:Sister chromatid cohesion protein n=1 Tax=Melampsora larici-populina (strain 98AG31 / pathotype 3-4-7) TaxID=747676 RepID=F4SA88_MELLP|nr:uncharacterized protein MELLADRAFT_69311 [Melampsora larici-populina 98AG31]EGF98446.1 hypothetical protein MELLADRAFT_69311 [Melampsora larici-populina 98AG31]